MLRQISQLVLQTPKKVIHVSYWRFAVWWWLILSVHVITCAFNAFYAYSYWKLKDTYLGLCFAFYQIGMPEKDHHTIAIVHGIMAAIHGFCLLLMLGGSLRQQSLAFTPWSSTKIGDVLKSKRTGSSALLRSFSKAYGRIAYPFGLCGVNGKYFDVALICREIVETALQTVQAYRMSVLLPRTLLNRFYVILLAAKFWSSIVADSVFFGRDESRRRFACIVLDCMLDLMASTGVQLLVMANYLDDYNPTIKGFNEDIWYNDEWVARALNEFRMVVVVSWSDLVSRSIFSLGLVITTTSMKRLLWRLPRNVNRVAQSTTSIVLAIGATKKFLQNQKTKIQGPTPVEVLMQYRREERTFSTSLAARVRHGDRAVLCLVHLVFGAWAIVVLGLHIHASVQPTLPQCFMQVRPWTVSRASCYLVGLDCHLLGISGKKHEVEEKWSEFDASTVVQLLIRHCSGLEVPDIFTKFSGLHSINVYNTTIVDWGETAAITNANHTNLAALYLVRVNMTDGLLPIGLQSTEFSKSMNDIEICISNLQEFPGDLATKWPRGGLICVEYSRLTSIPHVLLELQPSYFSVAGNPSTEIPPEIFEVPNLIYLGISEMDLHELPRDVTHLSKTLSRIYITNTDISFFWSWMDEFVESTKEKEAPLRAAGSTYCNDLEKLGTGTVDSFLVPLSPEYSTILMNSTAENLPKILKTVNCSTFYTGLFYPLTFEDKINAISTPPALVRQR